MKSIHMIAFILLVIGGLNWLLVGLITGWDLANYIGPTIARIVYILVGLSAIYEAAMHKQNCRACCMPDKMMPMDKPADKMM